MSTKHSTTKRGRPNQQYGNLKLLLATGSFIATIVGTQMLPMQDTEATETPTQTSNPITIVVPADTGNSIPLPPGERRKQVELQAIPQVVQPNIRPVARTRSS